MCWCKIDNCENMPGLLYAILDEEIRTKQEELDRELIQRAVDQKVADTEDQVLVRDALPKTDFGGTTTNSTTVTSGYTKESWFIDMTTYQRDGSTASVAGDYNEAINVDLDKQKVVGFLGVKKHTMNNVSAVKFGIATGVQIKDIWQVDFVDLGKSAYADTPIVYDSTNKVYILYYLTTRAPVDIRLLSRVAEAVGDTIMGGLK